jgi:addiction module HigA family antidote
MLAEEFLSPMGISQRKLAEGLHVSYRSVHEIVKQRRGLTPSMALRLARFFRTSGAFWMSLQQRWDLYEVQKAQAVELKRITPHATRAA